MASVEEDFPRGGRAKKPNVTGSKPATIQTHVEVDNLFESKEPEFKKKRKSGKQDDEKKLKKLKTGKDGHLKLNTTSDVKILHFKNLKVGILLLGCVKEVSDFEVVVGLPSGLNGFLPVINICDAYTKILTDQLDTGDNVEELCSLPKLYSPGMLVRCVVSTLDSAKDGLVSLKLSVNPKEVNKALNLGSLKAGMTLSGCVESVEDHGFLIDIGISGTKAFLPKQTAKEDLKVGQYVTCVLEEVKNEGRVVRLSLNPAAAAQSCAEPEHGWTLSNLAPGLLVKATVKKVSPHGLILEFLSSYTGVVDFMHIDADKASSYSPGDKVRARVLYVEPSERAVGLSLRSHLLPPGGAVLESVLSERVGEVLQGCRITAVHYNSGAMLELPDQTPAFVHKNFMKEPKEEFNPNRLMAQPQHTCRITDYSPMEQMHLVSLRKSTIAAPFFRYHDIKPGQVVEGTVTQLHRFGMNVKITDHIKGMVPSTHLADIVMKNPEKKFTAGIRVKCRVLSVDVQNKRLTLTRKKALVNSTLPLILSYADARPGRTSHGFVVCVKDFGCIVRFYGDVKGLVPVHELGCEPLAVPGNLFYVGQVVKAKVLKCDAENEKLLLSLKAAAEGATEGQDTRLSEFDFEIGKKVEAKVLSKVINGLQVSVLPDEAPAHLPTVHLSDHASNCLLLWAALQEGDIISNLVCLSRTRHITLSKKPLVQQALEDGAVVREFSDVQVGMQLVGWIKNIMPYGVFVEFPHGLFGLAPKAAMSDKFINTTSDAFQVGQTVVAKVTNLDEQKRRFLVSLKVSDMSVAEGESHSRLIQGQRERTATLEMMACRGDSELLRLGQKLKMVVGEEREDGSVSLVADQLSRATALATKHHATGVNVTPGRQVSAVILHVDPVTSQVHVSLLQKLLGQRETLEKGSKHTATVQYVEKDFAVVSLGSTGHLTVVPTTNHLNETFRFESEKLSVGRTLSVAVADPSSEGLGGLALVSWELTAAPRRARPASACKGPRHGLNCGDVVTATVKSIRPTVVMVTLEAGVPGIVHVSEVQESPKVGSFPTSSLKVGAEVEARVIGGKEVKGHRFLPISHPNFKYSLLELTLLPSKLKEEVDLQSLEAEPQLESYQPGEEVTCYVSKYLADRKCLEVTVTPNIMGTVELLAMTSDPKEAKRPEKLYKLGQAVLAKVVGVSTSTHPQLFLSLTGTHKLEQGAVTMGTIRKVVPHVGLSVKLPFGGSGLASVTDLSDTYRANPLEPHHEGQVVRCCVVGEEEGKFHLSLRPSRTHPGKGLSVKDVEVLSIDQLKEGQIIQGFVKSIGEQGIFVRLSRDITGRAQFQQASKYFLSNHNVFAKHVPQDALLTAKILSVDRENSHVDLSLLPEDTGKADILPEAVGLPLRLQGEEKEQHDLRALKRKRKLSESKPEPPAEKKKKKKKTKTDENDSGVEVYFREEEEGEEEEKKKKKKKEGGSPKKAVSVQQAPAGPTRLQVSAGFSWDSALSALRPAAAAALGAESSDGEDNEEQSKPLKKTLKEKAEEKRQAELQLSRVELELMDPGRRPGDAAAFERLVLASPDSSLLWLQYMAFHLQATEIEQARAVAERALKTISFREEQEKLNVWVALLNLENLYGSEESLQKVFERAVQYCEPMPVYQQLADIYAKSNKIKEAEKLYQSMLKRFRQEKAVWQSYGSFLLRQGQSDAANVLLTRALQSLSAKEHVDLIAKFARLEFQYGDAERAKSMFDKILTSYPKRTDLWSVFIDLMVKHGSQKEVRDLLDRVIHLSVSVKKIKFFFKRYLEYEKRSGTPESVQAVKQKALQYVEARGTEVAS